MDDIKRRARRAYERGRLARALPWAAVALPIAVLAWLSGGSPGVAAGAGAAAVGLHWWGMAPGRALPVGLGAGAAGYVVPWFVAACGGVACLSPATCVAVSLAAGLGVGTAVGLRATVDADPWGFAASGAGLAALVGASACWVLGVAAVLGVAVGVAVAVGGTVALARAGSGFAR